MSDYITTKKGRVRYNFVTRKDDEQNELYPKTSFYQICTFANPKTGKYHIRRFAVNDKNEFDDIRNFHISKDQLKKFVDSHKRHEYRCFNSYSLASIDFPTVADINMSRSDILSKDFDYTGYAPF